MKPISFVNYYLPLIGFVLVGGNVVEASIFRSTQDLSRRPGLSIKASGYIKDGATSSIQAFLTIRGGAKNGTKKTPKTAVAPKKKKSSSSSTSKKAKKKNTDPEKEKISEALHEKDAAVAMGDAIRERADQWRQSPFLDTIDTSLASVGFAMGAADQSSRFLDDDTTAAAGGVEAATTSVVVHYFLKSHGGVHAVQSVCSLLAAVSGMGAIFLPATYRLALLRRCMIFAMTKHLAGILAACVLTARAIPEVGLSEARQRIEDLVQDPVAQYVFYAACLLVWLPTKMVADAPPLWWQQYPIIPVLFTGPILLREVVSTLFVLSDVLLLWVYSNQQAEGASPLVGLIKMGKSTVNALMSLLITAKVWRSADALQRQAILARLVSRVSLSMEVLVGLVLVGDAFFQAASLGLGEKRPSFLSVIKAVICARLYVNFLWTRRRRIRKLATKIRGGAADLPIYVLNVMLDPLAAMGLRDSKEESFD
eukprot:scaffold40341_cov176-Amphora_coffeaeformis.AAC.2